MNNTYLVIASIFSLICGIKLFYSYFISKHYWYKKLNSVIIEWIYLIGVKKWKKIEKYGYL